MYIAVIDAVLDEAIEIVKVKKAFDPTYENVKKYLDDEGYDTDYIEWSVFTNRPSVKYVNGNG